MMKQYPIQKFWQKLMVKSKSVNKIPTEYLKYSENARIYDGWIWPRRWKQLFTDSTLWTNNKGGFLMWWKIYQIANSKIYEISSLWVQTEKASLWYDKRTDTLTYNNFTIIASEWESIKVFDWTNVSTPATVPATNNGILEYCRWFSFLASNNVLYISRPITPANPTYAYDWTWSWSQTITYDSTIKGLKGTMNWLYVFTEDKIEFLWANALQNVAGASAFISTPLWDWWELMNNQLIATSGDKVFYVTKNLNINTINYVQGTAEPWLWELSNQPVISIRELMQTLDTEQPSGFAFVNDNDNTVQFHLRTNNSPFNDICIVYDLINTTWNIDTGKNYNFVLRNWAEYIGFSDINSSLYKDDVGNSNAWVPIQFKIVTQDISFWTMLHKNFGGFFTAWAINYLSTLQYKVYVDNEEVFIDEINGADLWWNLEWIWEIAGETMWWELIWWDLSYTNVLIPFDFTADVGRIYQAGIRCRIEITSQSQIQDFLIDILGIIAEQTMNRDISNTF